MSNEIEDIKKRLTALEMQELFIAKQVSIALCTIQYNATLGLFKGEELDSYAKLWGKKLDDAIEEIEASPVVESVFNVVDKFRDEFNAYIKATKVDTADKAMEIAHSFIKKYSPVALPLKAVREDDVWLVDIDVGALAVKVAKVKVDARTGDILSYEIPERTEKK